jgi:hypothetical protein
MYGECPPSQSQDTGFVLRGGDSVNRTCRTPGSNPANSRQDNATVSVDGHSRRITSGTRFSPRFSSGYYEPYFCTDFVGAGILDIGMNSDISAVRQRLRPSWWNVCQIQGRSRPILPRVATSLVNIEPACSHAKISMQEASATVPTKYVGSGGIRLTILPTDLVFSNEVVMDIITIFRIVHSRKRSQASYGE